MTWLLVLNLIGLILAIGMVLESFRPTLPKIAIPTMIPTTFRDPGRITRWGQM